jgi:hypothetical protein
MSMDLRGLVCLRRAAAELSHDRSGRDKRWSLAKRAFSALLAEVSRRGELILESATPAQRRVLFTTAIREDKDLHRFLPASSSDAPGRAEIYHITFWTEYRFIAQDPRKRYAETTRSKTVATSCGGIAEIRR